LERCRYLGGFEAFDVRLGIDKTERIGGFERGIQFLINAVIEQHLEPRAGIHAEMMSALAAGVESVLEIFLPDDFATAVTLQPQALGSDCMVGGFALRIFGAVRFSLEPGHDERRLCYKLAGRDGTRVRHLRRKTSGDTQTCGAG